MKIRFKTALLILLTTFLVFVLGYLWEFQEISRTKADVIQLMKTETVSPSVVENDSLVLSLSDFKDTVKPKEKVTYTISYQVKKDLKNVRLVGILGKPENDVTPNFSLNLGDLKKDSEGMFNLPFQIESSQGLIISRVTLSQIKKEAWWKKEKREVLATVDDIDQITQ